MLVNLRIHLIRVDNLTKLSILKIFTMTYDVNLFKKLLILSWNLTFLFL
jgi:hypothetical protein